MHRSLIALISVTAGFVLASALFLGWQRGFSEGARQATDQILARKEVAGEIIELRARLDEQQRAEDRISDTLLAAFSGAVAILAFVNIGIVVVGWLNFDREKAAVKAELLGEAGNLDNVVVRSMTDAMRSENEAIRAQVASVEQHLSELGRSSALTSSMVSFLYADSSYQSGLAAERHSRHLEAADHFAREAVQRAFANQKYWSCFSLLRTIENLRRVEDAELVLENLLDGIENSVNLLETLPPPLSECSQRAELAREIIEGLRHRAAESAEPPVEPPIS